MKPASQPAVPPEKSSFLHQTLLDVFGFREFRSLQEGIVGAALDGGDVLVVMPTGAGKSLCYQLPAAVSPGVTLVVSPLVALMRDQVGALRERTSFAELGCAYLNSSQTSTEQREVLDTLRAGRLKLLYVAPERFRAAGFLQALGQAKLARLVVDEAHCISQWGHDFRPDYLALSSAVESLGKPPITAVTATATRRVQHSIVANLAMKAPQVFIGGFDRPNLHFSAIRCKSDNERAAKLQKALPKLAARGGSGLIYVATRKQCEEVAGIAAQALAPLGVKAGYYHAGMDPTARNEVQSSWLSGDLHLLIATNAFGMGIDKPDVRYVIHWVYPESPEAYYQEAGRAGRDGRKSRCVVLYHFADKRLREYFIDNDALTLEKIQAAHAALCTRATLAAEADRDNGLYSEEGLPPVDENVVAIPRSWWQHNLGWNDLTARAVLGKLDHFDLVERLTESAERTVVRIVQKGIPVAVQREIERHLGSEQNERRSRLDEMIAYCKASSCRRRVLLEYFGDEHEATPREYCCDVCDAPEKFQTVSAASGMTREAAAPVGAVDGADIHSVLQGLDAMRPRVGRGKLSKVLRESGSRDIEKFQNAKSPLLGILRGCTVDQVNEFLDALVCEGLMAQAGEDDYFVMYVTPEGRAAWQEKRSVSITLPRAYTTPEVLDNDEPGAELFEELRTWRRRLADNEQVPPYRILSDKTLRAIAAIRPQDEDALAQVPGIGARKMERYGADILVVTGSVH